MKLEKDFKTIILAIVVFILIAINGYLLNQLNQKNTSFVNDKIVFNYEKVNQENDFYEINAKIINSKSFTSCTVNSFIKDRIIEFQKLANKQMPELVEQGFEGKYLLDISIEDYQTEKYISYVLKIGEYTGGANMNQIVNTFTFDKEKEQRINLSDLVKKDIFMDELKKELRNSEKDLFSGMVDDVSFQDVNSFYVEDNKVIILFSKYQIAPGAAGIVEVELNKESVIKN